MNRIIGIGSPFGADQLGWKAIDHLQNRALGDCELIKLDRPGMQLLNYFQNAQHVILIDAVYAQSEAGRVLRVAAEELADQNGISSSHGFGVAEAVALADRLGTLPVTLSLIGILTGDDPSTLPTIDIPMLEQQLQTLGVTMV
jgi:hydrogenase maturation protease